ncbi:MAG: hypothetical protein J1F18_01425 [Lachnospiraceae bacterium]|nr:hypothetical protein [Lachnospiraceae bacterium]
MTSRNSFWANCIENHKRRIWVWIVSVLGQLTVYPAFVMIYLSRIRTWYAQGIYRTYEEYHDVMYRVAAEALGFRHAMVSAVGLSFIIGIQGFAYLHDKRKVDLYHSVPVEKNRRFLVVYLNGIFIYLVSTVFSVLLGIVIAAAQNAVNDLVLSEVGLAFIWNLLFFLVVYHTVILAVMLTGNRLITVCMAGALLLYEPILYELNTYMQYAYFETVSRTYVSPAPKFSAVYDYFSEAFDLSDSVWTKGVGGLAEVVLPYCGKWLILAVVILAAAWFCYRKRPSESAGKAIAFVKTEPFLKVILAVPFSIGVGIIIYDASNGSNSLTVASMLIGGVIACAAAEVIYDFDIKSLIKHPLSGGVAIVGIVVIFLIYKNDLLGYDKYVPREGQVESVAMCLDYYEGTFWKEDFSSYTMADYHKDHMFITDVEAVLALASKSQQEAVGDKEVCDVRVVPVLYRLKSGREVGRNIWIDFADPANEALMNRIVGSEEWKEGAYQVMTDGESYNQVQAMSYSNGATGVALLPEDAQRLRNAYVKDMEKFDFTLATKERPCGRIDILFPKYRYTHLYVYENFENTIAYLNEQEAFYPVQLNPEDIADITVTNYHYDLKDEAIYTGQAGYNLAMGAQAEAVVYDAPVYDTPHGASTTTTVSTTFDDEEQIAQIVPVIYPSYLTVSWHDGTQEMDRNYDIYVTFKKDTTYPYDRTQRGVYYKFYVGQVPDFVVEATSLDAKTE